MKTLFASFVFLASLSTFAAGSIATEVKRLEKAVYAISANQVKGQNLQEMLQDYANQNDLNEDLETPLQIILDASYEQLPDIDGGEDTLGTIKSWEDGAHYLASLVDDRYDSETTNIIEIVENLHKQGALIGFQSRGGHACGIRFPSVLIIDLKNKVIYELIVVGGTC